MLKIHETLLDSGEARQVHLTAGGGAIVAGAERLDLPAGALSAVMRRFGGPLETSERVVAVAELALGDGGTLRHVRHRARYDVIARDYLVLETPGEADALCALATTVAGALEHLARGARKEEP